MSRELAARLGTARLLLDSLQGQAGHAAASKVQSAAAVATIAKASLTSEDWMSITPIGLAQLDQSNPRALIYNYGNAAPLLP